MTSHQIVKTLRQVHVRNERSPFPGTIGIARNKKTAHPHQEAELDQDNGELKTHANHNVSNRSSCHRENVAAL